MLAWHDTPCDKLRGHSIDDLYAAAAAARLAGIHPTIVKWYLHCGDCSIISVMEHYEMLLKRVSRDEALSRIRQTHLEACTFRLREAGKL